MGRWVAGTFLVGFSIAAVLASGLGRAPENEVDRLDPIGEDASRQFEGGRGIEPLTIVVNNRSYQLSGSDGAGGVMFGGVGASCNADDTAFVFTASGGPSPVWTSAVRIGEHWFRTRQCLPEGIQ